MIIFCCKTGQNGVYAGYGNQAFEDGKAPKVIENAR